MLHASSWLLNDAKSLKEAHKKWRMGVVGWSLQAAALQTLL
jgi:hypothetical protein